MTTTLSMFLHCKSIDKNSESLDDFLWDCNSILLKWCPPFRPYDDSVSYVNTCSSAPAEGNSFTLTRTWLPFVLKILAFGFSYFYFYFFNSKGLLPSIQMIYDLYFFFLTLIEFRWNKFLIGQFHASKLIVQIWELMTPQRSGMYFF